MPGAMASAKNITAPTMEPDLSGVEESKADDTKIPATMSNGTAVIQQSTRCGKVRYMAIVYVGWKWKERWEFEDSPLKRAESLPPLTPIRSTRSPRSIP